MKNVSRTKRASKSISARAFDEKFDRGENLSGFLDLKKAAVVQRVNVDFPAWMVKMLDQEALKLNISRQAIIKTWLRERLDPLHHMTR